MLWGAKRFVAQSNQDELLNPSVKDWSCQQSTYSVKGERQLKEQAKHLENVERLKWVLDSEHLKSRGKSISISALKQFDPTKSYTYHF